VNGERRCVLCGERFARLDSDFRAGAVMRVFCSDCIDAPAEELVTRNRRMLAIVAYEVPSEVTV
jgi:hypothetical protein